MASTMARTSGVDPIDKVADCRHMLHGHTQYILRVGTSICMDKPTPHDLRDRRVGACLGEVYTNPAPITLPLLRYYDWPPRQTMASSEDISGSGNICIYLHTCGVLCTVGCLGKPATTHNPRTNRRAVDSAANSCPHCTRGNAPIPPLHSESAGLPCVHCPVHV